MAERLSNSETDVDNSFESGNSGQEPTTKRRRGNEARQLTVTEIRSPLAPSRSDSTLAGGKVSVAELYPAEMLVNLAGSTSAQVRRMNADERALVHYKRRLRNRESAKRSRARRQATLREIQSELSDLREVTASLLERCVCLARESDRQRTDIAILRKERSLLESLLRGSDKSH